MRKKLRKEKEKVENVYENQSAIEAAGVYCLLCNDLLLC